MASVITQSTVQAFSRHIVSFVAGAVVMAVGFFAFFGPICHIDPNGISQIIIALKAIGTGIASLTGGIAAMTSAGMAIWAVLNSTPGAQAAAAASVDGAQVVTTPEIAKAAASPDVVSNTQAVVLRGDQ